MSTVNINKSIQAISFYLVKSISRARNCTEEDALKSLLKTSTYELLQDKDSRLYAEAPEYVYSMLKDEQDGNVESWIRN